MISKPATGPLAPETPIGAALAHRLEESWPLGREVGWLRQLGRGAADGGQRSSVRLRYNRYRPSRADP